MYTTKSTKLPKILSVKRCDLYIANQLISLAVNFIRVSKVWLMVTTQTSH